MTHVGKKPRFLSGELKTLIGLICLISLLFIWLDYRDISHDEISATDCRDLNERWTQTYKTLFRFSKSLTVDNFECPTRVSGLVLGLRFLEETEFALELNGKPIDFWRMLTDLKPEFGENSGLLFAGRASYESNRIDINPKLLTRGDPVEIAGVFVHEARHLQQGLNTHVKCVRDQRLTCDRRLAEDLTEGDAYSYSVLFNDRVLRGSNANAQDQRSAARLLDEVLKNRFNAVRPDLLERYQP